MASSASDAEVSEITQIYSWLDRHSSEAIEEECLLIAEIKQFSDERIHLPDLEHEFDYDLGNKLNFISHHAIFYIIPNSTTASEDGKQHVAICFKCNNKIFPVFEPCLASCFVSVIDGSNSEQHMQSYTYFPNKDNSGFFIGKIISRETLLKERNELLPNDCLKLQITLYFRSIGFTTREPNFVTDGSFRTLKVLREKEFYVSLDSEACDILRKVSVWFQIVSERDMIEKIQGKVRIPERHFLSLLHIIRIIEGYRESIKCFEEIYDMVIFADYYGIECITYICRIILKCFLCSKNANVRKVAEESFKKVSLFPDGERDILERFIVSSRDVTAQEQLEYSTGEKNSFFFDILKEGNFVKTKWICKVSNTSPIAYLCAFNEDLKKLDEEKSNFDFYQ